MTDPRSAGDAVNCFVCGPANPIGLKMQFSLDNGVCTGHFTPQDHHCGFDGVTHGGIVFAVLDDVTANWLFLQGKRGYTARCDVRYRQPLPTGTAVRAEARLVSSRRNLYVLDGQLLRKDNDALVAQCTARFMVTGESQ